MKIYQPKILADFQFIADLWSEPRNSKFMLTTTMSVEDVKDRFKIKNNFTYIVEINGNQIGNLNLKKLSSGKTGRIGIIIDFKSQGNGYGEEAMKLLEKEAKKMGIIKLKLEVFVENMRAVKLYKKLGYKETDSLIAMEKIL